MVLSYPSTSYLLAGLTSSPHLAREEMKLYITEPVDHRVRLWTNAAQTRALGLVLNVP